MINISMQTTCFRGAQEVDSFQIHSGATCCFTGEEVNFHTAEAPLEKVEKELGRWIVGKSTDHANLRTCIRIPSALVRGQAWLLTPVTPAPCGVQAANCCSLLASQSSKNSEFQDIRDPPPASIFAHMGTWTHTYTMNTQIIIK